MKNEFNNNLLSNIEMPEDMKQDLYDSCKNGKSRSDFRFRHSGAIMAALIISAVSLTGVGASAAAIFTFANRMEEMPQEEKTAYKQEVKKDNFVVTTEGFSRELTNDEILRILKLERDYYDRSVFPKQEMAHYETAADRGVDELAYVAEDNLVYMPDNMSDEQLLQYIDHDAKKRYVNIEQLKKDGIEPGAGMALESTPVKEGSVESKAIQAAKELIRENYGESVTDKWIALIDYYPDNEFRNKEKTPLYHMSFYQAGIGYETRYEVSVNAKDMSPLLLNKNSFEDTLRVKTFSVEEAKTYADKGEKAAIKAVEKMFGFSDPVKVKVDTEINADEDGNTSMIEYTLKYANKAIVYVAYQIDGDKVVDYSRA